VLAELLHLGSRFHEDGIALLHLGKEENHEVQLVDEGIGRCYLSTSHIGFSLRFVAEDTGRSRTAAQLRNLPCYSSAIGREHSSNTCASPRLSSVRAEIAIIAVYSRSSCSMRS